MASKIRQIPERLLVKLWIERATREKSFRAGDGRRFRVIYPGRIGTTAGPDLRGVVLEEEGVGLVRGDVEVHVQRGDWAAHGHGRDPRYNGVVLHVVAGEDTGFTTLHNGARVPLVSMEPLLRKGGSAGRDPDLWPLLGTHGYVPPRSAVEMAVLLDAAGGSRFLGKCRGFRALLEEEGPDQVLYASLMDALGYSQNREPFRELARRATYGLLARAVLERPPWERSAIIEGILLTTAGFMPSEGTSPRRGRFAAASGRLMGLDRWHLFRVRPQNHPRRRIQGFARVLDVYLPPPVDGRLPWAGKGLVAGMVALVSAPTDLIQKGGRSRALEAALSVDGAPLPERAVPYPGGAAAAIGRARARDMAVNCVLPFVHALTQREGDDRLARLCLRVYWEFPSLQENELTREMRRQLLHPGGRSGRPGAGNWSKLVCSARRQQGLLHLHHLMTSPRVASPEKLIRSPVAIDAPPNTPVERTGAAHSRRQGMAT